MAILINSSVAQGSELKTASTATTSFFADEKLFGVGGFSITRNVAIAAAIGLLVGMVIKSE